MGNRTFDILQRIGQEQKVGPGPYKDEYEIVFAEFDREARSNAIAIGRAAVATDYSGSVVIGRAAIANGGFNEE